MEKQITLLAKHLLAMNRVQMEVPAPSGTFKHFFPIDKITKSETVIVCQVAGNEFSFKPEDRLVVDVMYLYPAQKQFMYGVQTLVLVENRLDRKEKVTNRRYEANPKNDVKTGDIAITRDAKQRKTGIQFKITNWPAWMPDLTPDLRGQIEMSKSWAAIEKILLQSVGASGIEEVKDEKEEIDDMD